MENRLKEIFADILEVDENELSDDFGPSECSSWDSLNNLRLITAIEEGFGVSFSMEEIQSMTNFDKVKALLAEHLRKE